jgi:hypothetical protein
MAFIHNANHLFHILICSFKIRDRVKNYYHLIISLFPILTWITRYSQLNIDIRYIGWLTVTGLGEVIAGLTVGLIVVPQGLSDVCSGEFLFCLFVFLFLNNL